MRAIRIPVTPKESPADSPSTPIPANEIHQECTPNEVAGRVASRVGGRSEWPQKGRKSRSKEASRKYQDKNERESAWRGLDVSGRGRHAPEACLGGLGLAGDTARVLAARLVEPSLDTRLPVLAEVVAVEDAVRRVARVSTSVGVYGGACTARTEGARRRCSLVLAELDTTKGNASERDREVSADQSRRVECVRTPMAAGGGRRGAHGSRGWPLLVSPARDFASFPSFAASTAARRLELDHPRAAPGSFATSSHHLASVGNSQHHYSPPALLL